MQSDVLFRRDERKLLADRLDEWDSMKGTGKIPHTDGELFSPRDKLVDDLVQELLERFPERDLTVDPTHSLAWSQKERDRLHTRVRRFMYNASARRRPLDDQPGLPKPRNVNVLTLFKQRYAKQIRARRDRLGGGKEGTELLRVYNSAVQEELSELRTKSPDEYAALVSAAAALREEAKRPFEDLSAEVQQAILDVLPGEIVRALKDWERRTGARIYIMCVWTGPDGAPSAFDYATKNCGSFLASAACKEIRTKYHEWMKDKHGAILGRNHEEAPPRVYPDIKGWPMLPDVFKLNLKHADRKALLRRWFTCSSMAMGGVQPSYARIERRMLKEPGSCVSLARMPSDYPVLRDMRSWVRAETDSWSRLVLDGQTGKIPPERRFAWRLVPRPPKEPDMIIEVPDFTAKPHTLLRWTAEELLYKERMALEQGLPHQTDVSAQGLPLARTTHIYVPYSIELFQGLETIHEEEEAMRDLLTEIAKMEELGPIHKATGLSDGTNVRSVHVPAKGEPSLTNRLQPADWLPPAFFDRSMDEHSEWAISTLYKWITETRPHVDSDTSTVYGGPLGVRTLAFALSRVWQNIRRVSRGKDIPAPVLKVAKGPNRTWSEARAIRLVNECIDQLRHDIARSRGVLVLSYRQRASQWEEMIRMATEQHLQRGTAQKAEARDRGPSATSGVPKSMSLLLDMHEAISEKGAQHTEADPEEEASTIVWERREESIREAREIERELSAEYINIFQDESTSGLSRNTHTPTLSEAASVAGRASTVGSTGNHAFRMSSGSGSETSLQKAAKTKVRARPRAKKQPATAARAESPVAEESDAAVRRSRRSSVRSARAQDAIDQAPKGKYYKGRK